MTIKPDSLILVEPKAKAGDPDAQYGLGYLYYGGEGGVAQSYEQAIEWFGRAAKQGHPRATYSLAVCYLKGYGVKQDLGKALSYGLRAIEYFQKNAEQGDLEAQGMLATCYENGDFIEKNSDEAVKWCRKAAERDAFYQYRLGLYYRDGIGVEQDFTAAKEWFEKAVENGESQALCQIGLLYEKGFGVEQNIAEAFRMYMQSMFTPRTSNIFNMAASCIRSLLLNPKTRISNNGESSNGVVVAFEDDTEYFSPRGMVIPRTGSPSRPGPEQLDPEGHIPG